MVGFPMKGTNWEIRKVLHFPFFLPHSFGLCSTFKSSLHGNMGILFHFLYDIEFFYEMLHVFPWFVLKIGSRIWWVLGNCCHAKFLNFNEYWNLTMKPYKLFYRPFAVGEALSKLFESLYINYFTMEKQIMYPWSTKSMTP